MKELLKTLLRHDILLRLGLAVVIGLTLVQVPMYSWEGKLSNLRFQIHGKRTPRPDIVLIGFDEASIKSLGHGFPPTPEEHSYLINALSAAGVKGVGLLYDLTSLYSLDQLEALGSQVMDPLPTPVLSSDWKGYITRHFNGRLGELFGPIVPAGLTEDGFSYAKDKVSRRLITHLNGIPQFELQMAQLLNPSVQPRGLYQNDNFPEMQLTEMLIHFDGPSSTYPIHSFSDFIFQRKQITDLRDKIVLIGRADFNEPEESRFNPFETKQLNLTKLETDAQAIASVLNENGLIKPTNRTNAAITMSATVLASFITMGSSPATGVLFLLLAIFGVFLLSQGLFSFFGVSVTTVYPILGILITYYIYVPYRLIVEYRKRFYYQKKHNLLQQVEELKTNFISLMSHDIKTPIAKIHGLAESGLQQPQKSQEYFHSILASADELTRFVNCILDLSKVESGSMKLSLTSKDLNELIKECVEKVEFFARKRGIHIKLDLEPMFSVNMDPNLIRQVIQNLLDNSLKYSKDNSTITVSTKDVGDHVEFSISDEGEGIAADDLEHVFDKFYRPQKTISQKHSGTGLGLYLVRYFVQLHKGHVSAESRQGIGSTFKVSLPTTI